MIGILNNDNYYDCYISAGIGEYDSFTIDFLNEYNINNSYAFDNSIINYPHYTNKITFIKKNINYYNDNNNTNLLFLIEKYNDIFLKMDIEGGEYWWILSLKKEQLKKIKQIVIEFHEITNNYVIDNKYKIKCIKKLNKTHYLIHAHNNNCTKHYTNEEYKYEIPNVIELTYINKKCFDKMPELNKTPLPIKGIDYGNNGSDYNIDGYSKDIELKYPFVSI